MTKPDNIEQTPLQALIREVGLHMGATFVPRSQTDNASETESQKMQIHWRVRVYREKRSAEITTDYRMGIGLLPKSAQVSSSQRLSVDEYNALVKVLETGKYSPNRVTYAGTPLPPPSITDVLHCLVSDAGALDHGSFEDWASNLGYDADSRKAEKIYRACLDTGLALRRMLSDVELAKLQEAFQDY